MWQQLRIQLESNDCMALEQQLLEAGAISMTYIDAADQPIYIDHPIFQKEPNDSPLWKDTCLLCMFDKGKNLEPLVEKLKHLYLKMFKWECLFGWHFEDFFQLLFIQDLIS